MYILFNFYWVNCRSVCWRKIFGSSSKIYQRINLKL